MTAAAEMMKDVREALESAFGLGPTKEQIERREQEAEARAAFRAVAEDMERWQKFWDEQRRRAEEAALPMRAAPCAFEIRQNFRQAAAGQRDRSTLAWREYENGGVSLTDPFSGLFDGDESFNCDDFDEGAHYGYDAA